MVQNISVYLASVAILIAPYRKVCTADIDLRMMHTILEFYGHIRLGL
jgi:hypothetical protein